MPAGNRPSSSWSPCRQPCIGTWRRCRPSLRRTPGTPPARRQSAPTPLTSRFSCTRPGTTRESRRPPSHAAIRAGPRRSSSTRTASRRLRGTRPRTRNMRTAAAIRAGRPCAWQSARSLAGRRSAGIPGRSRSCRYSVGGLREPSPSRPRAANHRRRRPSAGCGTACCG